MRLITLCLFALLFGFAQAQAQEYNEVKIVFQNIAYRAWILTQNEVELKGSFVHFVSDSGLYIREGTMEVNTVNFIPFKDIKKVKFRRKGSAAFGALIGAGAFFAIGGTAAYAKDSESQFLFSGLALAPLGAIIGSVFGSRKIHVPIPKDEKIPESTLDLLRKYSLADETRTVGYLQQYYTVPIIMPELRY